MLSKTQAVQAKVVANPNDHFQDPEFRIGQLPSSEDQPEILHLPAYRSSQTCQTCLG